MATAPVSQAQINLIQLEISNLLNQITLLQQRCLRIENQLGKVQDQVAKVKKG